MSTVIEQKAKLADSIRYTIADDKIAEWAAMYLPLTIASIDDKDGLKAVHNARMTVKNARIDVEKTRKALKADALEFGRAVDAEAKRITSLLEPIEAHLAAEEDRVEAEKERLRQAAEAAKQAKLQARVDELAEVGNVNTSLVLLANMTDADYQALLAQARVEWEAKKKAEEEAAAAEEARRRAEEERIAREEAEAARLRAEEDARRKAEAEALARERAELDRIRKEQEAEAARIAAERRAIEEREAAKRRAEELERAKAEAAEQARRDAEERAAREAAEAKAKAEAEEAERARIEALRPDREKLLALSDAIEAIERPVVTAEARKALAVCEKAILTAVAAIRRAANEL